MRDLRRTLLAINGAPDHVHLVVRYPPDLSHSGLPQQGRSSKWTNETFPEFGYFAWQEGYGGFTVSRSALPQVQEYITAQKQHHRRQDFKTEFLELLRRHGIEYAENEVFR